MAGLYGEENYPAGEKVPDNPQELVVRVIAHPKRVRISTYNRKSGNWDGWGWGMYIQDPELEAAIRKRFPKSAELLLSAIAESQSNDDAMWIRIADRVVHDEEVWGVSVNERGEII